MRRSRPDGIGARALGVAAGLAALLVAAAPAPAARAADPDPAVADADVRAEPREAWFSIGLLAGTTQFEAGLADYQWDTRPHAAWGVQGLAGLGRFAGGLRVRSTRTTQSIGDLGAPPRVRATSVELVGEARLAEWRGTRLLAGVGTGRVHLGYHPDRLTIQTGGGDVVVGLAPVNTWIAGGGVALERTLLPGWTVALAADRRVFAMDTAHRVGDVIVLARETFGDWSARLAFARIHRRR